MKCEPMKLPGGGMAFVCGGGRRRKKFNCTVCIKREATKECDYKEAGSDKMCNKPLCELCAVSVGPNLDHCPWHPKTTEAASG